MPVLPDEAAQAPRVYIVLVNWNGWQDTIECLESLMRLSYPNFRIVVCDNDSSDDSVDRIRAWTEGSLACKPVDSPVAKYTTPSCPKPVHCQVLELETGSPPTTACGILTVIQTGANLGFAGGNNVGIRFAMQQGDCAFAWLLNNDTIATPQALDHLVARALVETGIGIVGSTLCHYHRPDVVQALGGASFSKYRGRSRLAGFNLSFSQLSDEDRRQAERNLHWVSGASMLVSAAFLAEVGLMEEKYFLYYEELDWSIRATGRYRLGYAPGSLIYHKQGAATNESKRSQLSTYFKVRSRMKLYRKLLPAYIPFCLAATLKESLVCARRMDLQGVQTMWRAIADELLSREKS